MICSCFSIFPANIICRFDVSFFVIILCICSRALAIRQDHDHDRSRSRWCSHFRFQFAMIRCIHLGSHIKGLLINLVHHFWPDLIKGNSFLEEFVTPLMKVCKIVVVSCDAYIYLCRSFQVLSCYKFHKLILNSSFVKRW